MRRIADRSPLLTLPADQSFEWEARFLGISGSRFTVAQLRIKGEEPIYASHLNFPLQKIKLQEKSISELKPGNMLFFKATVGSYVSQGVKKGTLFLLENVSITAK